MSPGKKAGVAEQCGWLRRQGSAGSQQQQLSAGLWVFKDDGKPCSYLEQRSKYLKGSLQQTSVGKRARTEAERPLEDVALLDGCGPCPPMQRRGPAAVAVGSRLGLGIVRRPLAFQA